MPRHDGNTAPAEHATHTRDQRRALHAYQAVAGVSKEKRKDYRIAVNDLGANILRSGLAAAMAALERLEDRGRTLLDHLATAGVPGLHGATRDNLPDCVRRLPVEAYMIATREMIAVATWLKRAAQATFGDE
jgi:CRISPR/Cas system CMR-associated protein Cmr5 small subunit